MCLVSVIITSFNQVQFLNERVKSVINQTFKDFEVIIIDDSSTDGSQEFLKSLKIKYPETKIILKNQNSKSPFGRWEEAFGLAQGELIWIAEGDDLVDKRFLSRLVSSFENKSIVVAHSRSFEFRDSLDSKKLNDWWLSFDPFIWSKDFVMNGRELLINYGRFKCPIINVSSAVFRKSILSGIIIPKSYRYTGDWFFWGQILLKGKVAFVSEPLNYIRLHNNSATNSIQVNKWIKLIENTQVARKLHQFLGIDFKYNYNFKWLLLMWKKQTRKELFRGIYYSLKYLPFSFLVKYFSKQPK
ncbi:glycosyl transferase [Belliella baltica DSM 15883]|uniref:Glycosyl transferase n=1 Tax=Belliella baltica (strain DSM 15883 / CIP 108006 / LMG 21964 / BA134) TaxID=866536 RepID=I3Z755_BELBD|nr:glycosyltransferase family 2 protein [Belliella baltica]AFL85073.1 glycosyl transferase [Belliella baltica DSM 15883]